MRSHDCLKSIFYSKKAINDTIVSLKKEKVKIGTKEINTLIAIHEMLNLHPEHESSYFTTEYLQKFMFFNSVNYNFQVLYRILKNLYDLGYIERQNENRKLVAAINYSEPYRLSLTTKGKYLLKRLARSIESLP